MRRVSNPPNPWLSHQREWLEVEPPARLEVFEERAASILAQNDSPDIAFRYSVNPYRGCQHACAYCYARPTHEYLGLGAGTDFDELITVKINAPELLRKALAKRSWRRELVVFSGVTDCYQPLEASYELTRRCLEACHDFATPIGIVTKSFLVMRDADLIARMGAAAGARVYFSVPFADERIARVVERGAPPPRKRFDAMRRMRDAGVEVGLMLAPVIPGLNDRDIPAIIAQAADAGARTLGVVPLRLAGSVRDVFLERIRAELPDHAARIEARVRDMRGGGLNNANFGDRMRGSGPYWEGVLSLIEKTARKFGMRVGREGGEGPPDQTTPVANRQKPPPGVVQLPLFGG